MLSSRPRLENIVIQILDDSSITATDRAQKINELLRQNPNKTSLFFGDYPFDDLDAKILSEGAKGTHLTTLDLRSKRIGEQGLADLRGNLQDTYVTSVALDYDPFREEDVFSSRRSDVLKIQYVTLKANQKRIANERLVAYLFIKNRLDVPGLEITDTHRSNTISRWFESLTKRNVQEEPGFLNQHLYAENNEVRYVGGILLNNKLPKDIFNKILSYVPSLQLPARDLNTSSNRCSRSSYELGNKILLHSDRIFLSAGFSSSIAIGSYFATTSIPFGFLLPIFIILYAALHSGMQIFIQKQLPEIAEKNRDTSATLLDRLYIINAYNQTISNFSHTDDNTRADQAGLADLNAASEFGSALSFRKRAVVGDATNEDAPQPAVLKRPHL